MTSLTKESGNYNAVGIFMLLLAVVGEICLAGNFFSVAAVLENISIDLNLSAWQAGFLQGVFGISYSVGLLVFAPLSRKWSSKTLYIVGLGGSGICVLLQFYASSFFEFSLLRVVIGFFNGAVWIGSMKIVMEWFEAKNHGTVIGIIIGAYSLAITLDFALGLPFTMSHGWRTFLMVLGFITIAAAIVAGLCLRKGPYQTATSKYEINTGFLKHIISSKWFWFATIAILGDLFAIGATTAWIVPSYLKTQGMSPELAPLVGTVLGISQIVLIVAGGYLSDRISKTGIILWGYVLTIISAVLLAISALYQLSFTMMLVIAAFAAIGAMSAGPIYSLLSNKFATDVAPASAGYAELGGVLGTFIAPFLMGLIISIVTVSHSTQTAFAGAFTLFAVVELIIFISLLALNKKAKKE